MKEQLITFATAKLAKEKGFDIESRFKSVVSVYNCYGIHGYGTIHYNRKIQDSSTHAPTQSLLQKWLREVHNINFQISTDDFCEWSFCLQVLDNDEETGYWTYFHKSYEEALEKGLQEALKLIKL